MLTINDIDKINSEDRLPLNLIYTLENLSDGYGVIYTRPYCFGKNSIICCKPINKCKELLKSCIYFENK